MNMEKEKTLEILGKIKYPGFNRDIVSFGMVKELSIKDENITLELNITSQNLDKKNQVVESVRSELAKHFTSVNIKLKNQVPQGLDVNQKNNPVSVLENVKHVIAIASGKGGVGKSTVAAHIASSFAKEGKKTGLLDLDIYGPSLPIILGLNEQPKMTQDNKLIPLEKYGMKVMSFGFISGNETPVIWRGPLVSRMTEQFFRDVDWGELDVLVLDLPPGTGDIQLTLTQKLRMTGAIIVTTPQDIALADVRKGADMFKKVNTPVLGVIENMSGLLLKGKIDTQDSGIVEINGRKTNISSDGLFSLEIDLFKTGGGQKESRRLDVPLLGKIPISEQITISTDEGRPLTTLDDSNEICQIYNAIAKKISSIINM